jgi:hypothetical protein
MIMDERSEAPKPHRRLFTRLHSGLSAPIWAGLSGLAAVVSILIALVSCIPSHPRSPDGSPPTASASVPVNVCSITGSTIDTGGGNVSLQCIAPLPKSLANVSFKLGSVLHALYFNDPATLPLPNTFVGYESGPYCHWWGEWPTAVSDLYLINPVINLTIEAGRDELVVVTDVRLSIFRRTPFVIEQLPRDSTALINCQVGGGSNLGNYITVDTVNSATTLVSDRDPDNGIFGDLTDPAPMPPASIDSKDIQHEGAQLSIRSLENYFYEGQFRIVARVNGVEQVVEIGSRERPFRWITDTDDRLVRARLDAYSWDPNALQWTRGGIYN